MNEDQQPQDHSAEQFDAEATQAAKDFLEEGVLRRSPDDKYKGTPGEVLDHTNFSLSNQAQLYAAAERGGHKKQSALEQAEKDNNARYHEEELAYATSLSQGDVESKAIHGDELDKLGDEGDEIEESLKDIKLRRDAANWRGRQHYLDNQAGYVAHAVEEANAAGHDVTIGGHHFPGQNTQQQPTQGQQLVEPKEPPLQ